MKTRISLVASLVLAFTLPVATLIWPSRPAWDALLRPGRKAPATSTPLPALPAWPPTAPRARCTPPTTVRSTRSSASRTARPWTSASLSPSRRRSRMPAATPTRPPRTPSAPTRSALSTRSTTSPARATTSSRRRRERSRARQRVDSTPCRSPTWRQLRSAATRPTASTSCPAWASATTMPPASRSTTSRRASTTSSTAHTTTAAAVSITATPRPNGRAVGTGTMETTYFGTATAWGSGDGPGPWIMADMEAGLFSGYNAKKNAADPTIDSWRFVTAVVDGGGGNKWDLRGGNAQQGGLTTFYSGVRPGSPANNALFPDAQAGGHPSGHRRRQRQRFVRHLL